MLRKYYTQYRPHCQDDLSKKLKFSEINKFARFHKANFVQTTNFNQYD